MEYTPYLHRQCDWPFKIIYNEYHYKHYSKGDEFEKLLIVKNDKIIVQGMWRMQLLGELHSGLWVLSYDDHTNWEYYDEVLWQIDSKEEREEFRRENLELDTYDDYFEELAAIAVEIGCERAEIKCLAKSLILKYRFNRVRDITDFPFDAFKKLYNRLISSKDLEQLRVAERLSRYHIKQLEQFLQSDVREKICRVDWVEED
ncbi:MAG: hypothetical protein SNI49_07535 [Rikenellaceae bacterium]